MLFKDIIRKMRLIGCTSQFILIATKQSMPWLISIILLLLIGIFPAAFTLSNDCPSSMCGDIEIAFPLTLESSSKTCRTEGLSANLSCSSTNDTVITLPSSEAYRVMAIYYEHQIVLKVQMSTSSISCPWRKDILKWPNVDGSIFRVSFSSVSLMSCPTKSSLRHDYGSVAGPIACLSGTNSFVYAMEEYERMDILPSCMKIHSGRFSCDLHDQCSSMKDMVQMSEQGQTAYLYANADKNFRTYSSCFDQGKKCGYSITKYEKFCFSQDSNHGSRLLVTGIAIGTTLMIFLITVLVVLYYFRKYNNEKKKRIKVEEFLATYKSTALTRYNFANIKKITKKFKHKLGQGGFGSVYKGELANGIPVAVKMLQASKSNGDDFVNEVATIGNIHHVNVVRLLGFCSDGTNRALVYEFMPNESLEKYIFFGDTKMKHEIFSMEKLQEIAIGIAQGIDYLHQGCNQRILHFDIKPHNILLDYDFNPKISDFGLAKLCSRDQSIVTISAARGTMGYIAPEVYSRNFGPVSHKSDVYSYGMLLLEMIGRRKNVDPNIENLSEIYFPEWIYNKLVSNTTLGLSMEMEGNEEFMKKLAVIALWCIQWNPTERPSMTKVVQMLNTNFQRLEMPPKPFVPSSDLLDSVNVPTNLDEILEV